MQARPLDYTQRDDRQRFYRRAAWRKLRAAHLAEHPWCRPCADEGHVTPASHVHHVEDVADAPERALDPTNLESACPSCHNAETARRQAA